MLPNINSNYLSLPIESSTMTKLVIFSPNERRRFDAPPLFNADEQLWYFSLTKETLEIFTKLRTPTTKVGFILQLGYFKANAKFFTAEQFRKKDIDYVTNMLGIDRHKVNFASYQKRILIDHRKKVLKLLRWNPFNHGQQEKITTHIKWLAQRQFSPKKLFLFAIDYCWQNKVELPSYNTLAILITGAYNQYEDELTAILESKLTLAHRTKLNTLVNEPNKQLMQRSSITKIKQINQSLRPTDIQANIENFKVLKEYFYEFKSIINDLNLPDQATEYFATWVQKSTTPQLNKFSNKNKLYLYLLSYIKHQFYSRHDVIIDVFLRSVRTAINHANNKLTKIEKENCSERNKAIKKLSENNKSSRVLIEKITETVKFPLLSGPEKLVKIETLVDNYNEQNTTLERNCVIQIENSLDKISKNESFFDALESFSRKLQGKVAELVKVVDFNTAILKGPLLDALYHFKLLDGKVNRDSPLDFLNANEKAIIFKAGKLRVSLYKILLFMHLADAIKSGHINLLYSYRYKTIHEYLINEDSWKSERDELIKHAGLVEFDNFKITIEKLKQQLDSKYRIINERFSNGENSYLVVDKNRKIKVTTPKIDSDETEYNSALLSQAGFIPVLTVLNDIDHITDFSSSFKHFSNKHKKLKPHAKTILAGILGKGCNIGINKLANISIGISENTLKNTVNWFFSLKNIQKANNKIISLIDKLFLANNYRNDNTILHTGSDGRKINVAVDSLHANYSYKYFGKQKGVSIYIFIDERQLLFHLTVISSSEREAAYVIDGLLQNEVVKSDIHSTDTHGFTETVFAATHLIGTAFAPRIKNIGDQKVYAFSSRKTYEKLGYQILPSRLINLKLIEDHWDDILRFMATIKLKYTSASQLFKRLSSYAKDHPLYRALKEFGRIIKSIFILTYLDDVDVRQRIEKQLNKGELANKFSKAVFFANNQEFKEGVQEDQEIAAACKMLIQNAIVLWNYLYLSQLIANHSNLEERRRMTGLMKRGSAIVWCHINFQGEYDFTKHAANDVKFDLGKILALRVF